MIIDFQPLCFHKYYFYRFYLFYCSVRYLTKNFNFWKINKEIMFCVGDEDIDSLEDEDWIQFADFTLSSR